MFPAWLQSFDGEWPEPFFKTASTFFPETAPTTAPPATIELTAVEMLLYTKVKLHGLDDGSTRQNRELNLRIKNRYDALDAHTPFFAWVVTIGLRAHWGRFGSLIESWLEDDFNIRQQRKELEMFFVEVAAAKDVNVSIKNGQPKVLGNTVEARLVCLVIGGCNPITDSPRK
ncbi:MAG: hypothetical protein LQ346_008248 [Caloplaca aetnensis]|nr:MAG: hypothetical protein LQ346_008248 [Caloplaca aetnensis]